MRQGDEWGSVIRQCCSKGFFCKESAHTHITPLRITLPEQQCGYSHYSNFASRLWSWIRRWQGWERELLGAFFPFNSTTSLSRTSEQIMQSQCPHLTLCGEGMGHTFTTLCATERLCGLIATFDWLVLPHCWGRCERMFTKLKITQEVCWRSLWDHVNNGLLYMPDVCLLSSLECRYSSQSHSLTGLTLQCSLTHQLS